MGQISLAVCILEALRSLGITWDAPGPLDDYWFTNGAEGYGPMVLKHGPVPFLAIETLCDRLGLSVIEVFFEAEKVGLTAGTNGSAE
ncbi:MAG: hypothetical protein E2O39_03410 [Planctomycetota bacterium]|nr:MAG: hypothetical protein E2O39_03410 [Planctomycetota bacterium]